MGYMPLTPPYATEWPSQRPPTGACFTGGGLKEGLHMFQSWGLLSGPDTDWYKSTPSAWTSAALHTTPPQLSWSVRGFNCLIIILHYPCGPIAWLGVVFSASPHPLLPKWRHPRNSSRWWWRVNWEGLSCCPGYRQWYFCCPNKHLIKNQPWGDTKWSKLRNVLIVMSTKSTWFSMRYTVKCVCKHYSALLLCIDFF